MNLNISLNKKMESAPVAKCNEKLLNKKQVFVKYFGLNMVNAALYVTKTQYPDLFQIIYDRHKGILNGGESLLLELSQLYLECGMVLVFDNYFYNNEFTKMINDKTVRAAFADGTYIRTYRAWKELSSKQKEDDHNKAAVAIHSDIESAAMNQPYMFNFFAKKDKISPTHNFIDLL